jgi:uncharacterized protein (DUF1501 family)
MAINRRDFLKLGSAGLALGTLAPLTRCPFLTRPIQAAMMGEAPAKKMILIFLRGGMDGVNAVIPHGDADYNDTDDSRPTLFIPEADSFDLNGFASAHPAFDKVVNEIPTDDVAYIHRVAYDNQNRSHFSSQQFWENGIPGNDVLEEGWVNRLMANHEDLNTLPFTSASISFGQQVLFRGPHPSAHIPDLGTYKLGNDDISNKMVGVAPDGDSGSGLVGIYSRDADESSYDELVRLHGLALVGSLEAVSTLDPNDYTPEGGAEYPTFADPGDFAFNFQAFNFFRQLRHAVQLLKETDCRVAGVELGGFDTHVNQDGSLNNLLSIVAHGMMTVYQDTEPSGLWDDMLVVSMSEFGRTSAENGSMGTDHGEASVMWAAGGGVNGGVYNCDADTWSDGDLFSVPGGFPRYVAHKTDYRTILAEIIDKHFAGGDFTNDVIPDWDDIVDSEDQFTYLDFLE